MKVLLKWHLLILEENKNIFPAHNVQTAVIQTGKHEALTGLK